MDCSIIIPLHKTTYLQDTFDSIKKQTVKPKDVIIIYREDQAWSKMNDGIRASKADAFICLGDDDMLDPTFIEKTLAVMEKEDCDIVYTDMEQFGDQHGIHRTYDWSPDKFPDNFLCFFTSLCKKSMWEKVGGYDEKIGYFADWDFWWSCAEKGARGVRIPEPLFLYRIHPGQASVNIPSDIAKRDREAVWKKHNYIKHA